MVDATIWPLRNGIDCDAESREGILSLRKWRIYLVLILGFHPASALSAAEESDPVEPDDPPWIVVGTFKGAADPGLLGQLSNVVFEYERDDSLFRDFGNLGIGVGGDIGDVGVDLDFNFRHRIVSSHELIPPGETITADDISILRKVSTARTRLRADWEYLPEIITDEDGIAIQFEGGFSVSASRAIPPSVSSSDPLAGLIANPEELEESSFKEEHDVNMKNHGVVYVTAGSAAAVVDSVSGRVGKQFADTEKAAVYWDEYAEPFMLFPKAGLPLKTRAFVGDSKMLATGDRLTFTSFVGLSPVVIGINQYGVRLGWKYFNRFIRETTIEMESDGFVKVRVRNWRGFGSELTPFKYRPEVRLWIITLGYTFFETVRDDFREKTSDEVYRIDLNNEEGMAFFQRIIKQSSRVNPNPKLPDPKEIDGMVTLASEVSNGKNQNFRLRANFFSWFRYNRTRLATTRKIATQDADMNEAMRLNTLEYRSHIGRQKDIRSRSAIIAQSDLRWNDNVLVEEQGEIQHPEDERLAIQFSTNYSNRWASAADIRAMVTGIAKILDFEEPDEVLSEFENFESEDRSRMTVYLDLSFGPRQLIRASKVSVDQVWITLAELLLGKEFKDAWATEGERFWWEPDAPPNRALDPGVGHISNHYDNLRGFDHRPKKRSRIFNPAEYRSSDLYRIAKQTFKKQERLDRVFRENPNCLRCLVKGYSTGKDILLIQAMAVRNAGGVERGGVGYDYQIQVGNMVRPLRARNDIVHGYQLPRVGDLLYNAEQTWESPPRLRAGQMLVNTRGTDHQLEEGEPCGLVRLFSDHYFADDLSLRMTWRQRRARADIPMAVEYASLGEPAEFTEKIAAKGFVDYSHIRSENVLGSEYSGFEDRQRSMQYGTNPFTGRFEEARYFYEIYVPRLDVPRNKKGYTILMRLLNTDGLPVSEEQEILVTAPKNFEQLVPAECWTGFVGSLSAEASAEGPEVVN